MNRRDHLRLMHLSLALIVLFGISDSSAGQDCRNIPTSFSSYDVALEKVKATTFKVKETAITSRSSWIRGATFYSCDSKVGFLVIKTDDREYIHQGVPIETWRAFKNAPSMGSYYHSYIRGRYGLVLND